MDEQAEKKYLAGLDFKIDDGLKNLDKLSTELEELSKKSEKLSDKLSNSISNSITKIDPSNVSKGAQKIYAEMEKSAKNSANKIAISREKANNQMLVDDNHTKNKMLLQEQKFQLQMNKQVKNGVGSRIKEYAQTFLIYQGFNELKQAARETVDEMVSVESQMVAIERVMEEGSIQVNSYRDELIQLAYDYGNSFENVADITLRLAQAGFDANESLMLTEKTLLALNTAELDATEATSDMVAVMAQWGLMTGTASEKAESYGNIIDKINKVADRYPTTSQDIMEALKKTSSAFNLAGASIDETIATIVAAETASQRGGKAIGTALSNITQQLKADNRITIAESLGLDFYTDETKTEFKDLMDIFGEMSDKMQELKDNGKENSTEMQNLLSIFTVFRRNVGASLLGEMSGEDSTYLRVLEDSLNSAGYSLKENEKYMKTAEAAQNQFNATLLELKTSVWDNGVEDVYRSMLLLGQDLVQSLTWMIDTFGALPIAVGTATLAISTFSKNLNVAKLTKYINQMKIMKQVVEGNYENLYKLSDEQIEIVSNLEKSGTSFKQYQGQVAKATVKTAALKAGTIALNAALSLGISAAVSLAVSAIEKLITAEQRAAEKREEELATTKENIINYRDEAESVEELVKEYEELGKKDVRSAEENIKIREIQKQITELAKEQSENVNLVNGSYEEQLAILKQISMEQLKQVKDEQSKEISQLRINNSGVDAPDMYSDALAELYMIDTGRNPFTMYGAELEEQLGIWRNEFESLNLQGQLDKLYELQDALIGAGQTGSESYEWVTEQIAELNAQQEEINDATDEYNDTLAQIAVREWFLDDDKIKTLEDYQKYMALLDEMPLDGMGNLREKVKGLLEEEFPHFNNQVELAAGNVAVLGSVINENLNELQKYADKYAILRTAQDEFNQSGQLTISTLQNLISNDLLQYLSIQDGQLQINAQSMLDLAEATKVAAIEALKDAASKDIEKAATNDVATMSDVAKGALAGFQTNAYNAGQQAATSAEQIAGLAGSLQAVADAAEGKLGEGVDVETYRRNVSAIISAYQGIANTIGNINIQTASYNPQTTRGSSSGGSSTAAANAAKREAEEAAREAEELRKAIVESFKETIEERERLEDRFVKNKKELGLLTNEDEKYILQESIKRYKKYAEEVSQLTQATEEEKAELRKKYLEEAEDLEIEYFNLLKDLLDEQIDELESKYDEDVEAYEDAIDKKIQKIEEQADAEIAALEKVEDVNDRLRQKEEYEANRKELIHGHQGVEYWEARTGREAQLALAEAKKKVEELDKNWEETTNEWNVEDQIELIEQRRDADIKATEDERDAYLAALEATKNADIQALKDKYQYQIDYFNQTGTIITDNARIQSEEMFKIYKENFVDPIGTELTKALSAQQTTTTTAVKPASTSTTYTIQYGDTLSAIASRYGTTIDKILAANPYVTNKNLIYAGKQLKIPTSHTGSKILRDGLVELQAGETVLNMDWAKGLDRMLGQFNNQTNNSNTFNNGNTINVKGNLVNLEAKVEDKADVTFLTKRITREIEQKFDIKK